MRNEPRKEISGVFFLLFSLYGTRKQLVGGISMKITFFKINMPHSTAEKGEKKDEYRNKNNSTDTGTGKG